MTCLCVRRDSYKGDRFSTPLSPLGRTLHSGCPKNSNGSNFVSPVTICRLSKVLEDPRPECLPRLSSLPAASSSPPMSMPPPSSLDPPLPFPQGALQSQHQGDNSAQQCQTSVGHNGIHRRQNEAAIVGSVISALQPTIAEAVAAALAATSTRPSSTSTSGSLSSGGSSGFVPARDSNATPAKYNYIYKVADDGTQTYISQEEQRDVSHTIISSSSIIFIFITGP